MNPLNVIPFHLLRWPKHMRFDILFYPISFSIPRLCVINLCGFHLTIDSSLSFDCLLFSWSFTDAGLQCAWRWDLIARKILAFVDHIIGHIRLLMDILMSK